LPALGISKPLTADVNRGPESPVERAGAWLFRQRTWIPVPLAVCLLLGPAGTWPSSGIVVAAGVMTIAAGEILRLRAVRHIGVVSRTRSDRLGPLVRTGPFASVRNPLYLGNLGIWIGFALAARLVWLAPIFFVVLGLEYHAIVRWEERLLESRRGQEYRQYAREVPRWLPRWSRPTPAAEGPPYSWVETLFSERGTLIAIAAGLVLLRLKSLF
jgi:protein-S-isoprenylcysteine O-methyltransferase Ste14